MRAMAKAQMLTRLPKDVEAIPIGKVSSVPVGRRYDQLHDLPLSKGVPTELKVLSRNSRNQGDRRFIAERFLNHVLEEYRFRLKFGELIRVREQEMNRIADQISDRYMPGQQEEHRIGDNLIVCETSLFRRGVDQRAKKIVPRIDAPFRKQGLRVVANPLRVSR